MNIFIISPNPIWGGAATANMAIARMLAGRHIVYYNDEYNALQIANVSYDAYPTHKSKNSNKLVNHLLELKIDFVIWGCAMNLPYYREATVLLHSKGIKQCSLFHSLAITHNWKGCVMDWLISKSIKEIDHLVFVSKYTDESWSRYYSVRRHANHHIIYNPIDVEDNQTRKLSNRIGFVGRFSPEKQPEIFAELSVNDTINQYIAWGDGVLLNKLKTTYKNVDFRGQSFNQKEIYDSFGILVMTSVFENCPMVILEAWTYGIPCIVPKVGGIPEIVNDGYTGLLYDTYSPDFIHECISKIQSDYMTYSQNCLSEVKKFSYESLYDKWEKILES